MNNGLDINEDDFLGMKLKDQNLILFKNVVHIRRKFVDYKVTRKIQYVWLSILSTIVLGWLGCKTWLLK